MTIGIAAAAIVLVALVAYFRTTNTPPPQSLPIPSVPASTPDPAPSQQNNQMPGLSAPYPVDLMIGERVNTSIPFINPSTQTSISFNSLTDEAHRGNVGPAYEVLVNQKNVGETWGYLLEPSFSPDDKYFGFKTHGNRGGGAFAEQVYVVDIAKSSLISVPRPTNEPRGKIYGSAKAAADLSGQIESYTWHGDAIDLVFYFVVLEYIEAKHEADYYRVTPKEIWRFDLTTQKYTLLETLSE